MVPTKNASSRTKERQHRFHTLRREVGGHVTDHVVDGQMVANIIMVVSQLSAQHEHCEHADRLSGQNVPIWFGAL